MRALLLFALLGIAFAWPSTAAPPDTSLADRLDTLVPELLERYQIPGAAVAVIRGGEVVKARGYGFADAEYRTPMTAETVLKIGSISKPVAAWGVMTLVEAGQIDLDAIYIDETEFYVLGERLLEHNPEHPFVTRRLDTIRN
jgi:CubicO group peptidase (beta-lactamase class C family)